MNNKKTTLCCLLGLGILSMTGCSRYHAAPEIKQIYTTPAMMEAAEPPAPIANVLMLGNVAGQSGVALRQVAHSPRTAIIPSTHINTQKYEEKIDNPIKRVSEQPISTFSIDVDTGAYTNTRQQIWRGQQLKPEGIRAEEFINYFNYDYPKNNPKLPFSTSSLLTVAPWNPDHRLLRIALKAQDIQATELPATNLVYLIDVSGSMQSEDKLELVKTSLIEMVEQLRKQDTISIVTYSGEEKVVLSGVSGQDKQKIKNAIHALTAAGSTNGESALKMAYQQAQNNFIKAGVNRILLLTDGDFNVGVSDTETLKNMIEQYQQKGIGLSTLGVGNNFYNDGLMEQLADIGHGKYSYLDSLGEARKVLVHEMSSTLANVAHDVKVQVEFNPTYVQEYRLLGYDNRQLAREDFNNDKVDAGDIGAGHTVTALYEIVPVGAKSSIDPLRYQAEQVVAQQKNDEIAYLRLRYKNPHSTTSQLLEQPIKMSDLIAWGNAGKDMYFATAAAQFAFKLQQRKDISLMTWKDLIALARQGATQDEFGQKQEMIALMQKAQLQYPD